MKKILAAFALVVALAAPSMAFFDGVQSSFSHVATVGPVQFSSGPVKFIAVTVTTPAANGLIAFFRSTSTTFTPEIATQTVVNCNYFLSRSSFTSNFVAPPETTWLFGVENDSYTFVNRVGACEATIWFTYPDPSINPVGNSGARKPAGLPFSGQR